MTNELHKDGTKLFTVESSDKLAVYSKEPVKIYTRTYGAHRLVPWTLLKTTTGGTEYLSSAFTEKKDVMMDSDSAIVYYSSGTDPVIDERRGGRGQGAPTALNVTGALTAAAIGSGIVTSTTAAAVAGTVPTGTVMDAAFEMEIGDSIDWSVIATGGNAFTVTGATGHTVVGTAAVATVTSGLFRTRKTAANTFVTYRIG